MIPEKKLYVEMPKTPEYIRIYWIAGKSIIRTYFAYYYNERNLWLTYDNNLNRYSIMDYL